LKEIERPEQDEKSHQTILSEPMFLKKLFPKGIYLA
jgi:hypothetical protein